MRFRMMGIVLIGAAGAWAWQDSFAQLKLNRETFERLVTGYVNENITRDHLVEPGAGKGVKDALLAMNDSARAAVVRELGLAAKAFVMSPAFQASYDAYIKNAYRAVNHGIAAPSGQAAQKGGQNFMRDSFRQSVTQRLPSIANFDKSTIEMMAGVDEGMVDMSNPQTPAEKAGVAKAKTMLAEAKKLAATDIAKARETYKAALMTAAGLKDEAEAKSSAEEDKRREEQRNYNDLLLRPRLKKRLAEFAALVKTVDFNAATTVKNNKIVFVNPAYERRDSLWKKLFRLGPGGANAAAQVAQQWAAEL